MKLWAVSVCSLVAMIGLFFLPKIANAATDIGLEIYKVTDASLPNYENNGYDKPAALANAQAMSGAKFTIIDVTSNYYDVFYPSKATSTTNPKDIYAEYVRIIQHESNAEVMARGVQVGSETNATDVNGFTSVAQLPTTSNGKDAIYVVLETTRPPAGHQANTGSEVATTVIGAIPTIVALPMFDQAGKELSTIKVYPKNEVGALTKTIEKKDEHVQRGQKVEYTITLNLPNDLATELKTGANAGKFKFASFAVNDIPGKGLTFQSFSKITVSSGVEQSLADFEKDYDVTATATPNAPFAGDGVKKAILSIAPKSNQYQANAKWANLAGKVVQVEVICEVNDEATVDTSIANKANYKVSETNGYEVVPAEDEIESLTHKYVFQKNDSITGAALAGAKFTVSISNALVDFVKVSDGVYKVATSGATGIVTELEVANDGTLTLLGLDSDVTYTLVEVVAPTGYRLSLTPIDFSPTAHDKNQTCGTFDVATDLPKGNNQTDGYHNIYNTPDTLLPSTGGTGMKMYLTVAVIGLSSAGVFMFMKQRMKRKA